MKNAGKAAGNPLADRAGGERESIEAPREIAMTNDETLLKAQISNAAHALFTAKGRLEMLPRDPDRRHNEGVRLIDAKNCIDAAIYWLADIADAKVTDLRETVARHKCDEITAILF